MPDPLDLSMVVSSALPATFTFLYERLNVALQRRRSDREAGPDAAPDIPDVLVGDLALPLRIDSDRLTSHAPVLEALALAMAPYERDRTMIVSDEVAVRQILGRVRDVLENIYGQRFTFQGETRARSGPFSEQHYDVVAGEVTGMEAQQAIRGSATSTIRAKSVEPGGRVVGMKAPVIEDRD
ncbi:hypothetical protein ACYSUO_35695 [Streptomyces sp. UC4497]